ncbi:MAG TPA: hypothetical protein PLL64_02680 [Rhodothermales bacterium]|nr:hypothetical protein [Rhodothermales bacterium]HRR09874.1 hypothetical protein [Rhodothermales bacterium]
MTIHRGLYELRLLDARITKTIQDLKPAEVRQKHKLIGSRTPESGGCRFESCLWYQQSAVYVGYFDACHAPIQPPTLLVAFAFILINPVLFTIIHTRMQYNLNTTGTLTGKPR